MALNRRNILRRHRAIRLYRSSALARMSLRRGDEIVVRLEKDIGNLDPGNRVGSVEDNIILAGLPEPGALQSRHDLDWEPMRPRPSRRNPKPRSSSSSIPARCSTAAMAR